MRIVVLGQAAFGAKTLEALVEKGEVVAGAYTPPDLPSGKIDPLKEAALSRGIPMFQPESYKSPMVLDQYRQLQPDLAILAFVTEIIPEPFLEAPTHGAICYHPSLLPRHRGASAINWAVIMGDPKTGLTVFWPDGGIDTGPILLQKEVTIEIEDTTGSLYFDRLFPLGIEAILESVSLIREGNAPRIPQLEDGATYEPPCDDRVALIDWARPAVHVHNLVRGCDPQPGAYTFFQGDKVRLYGARLDGPTGETPGTVVSIDSNGLRVALEGASLTVKKVRTPSGGKMSAPEFAERVDLKPGVHFGGLPPDDRVGRAPRLEPAPGLTPEPGPRPPRSQPPRPRHTPRPSSTAGVRKGGESKP